MAIASSAAAACRDGGWTDLPVEPPPVANGATTGGTAGISVGSAAAGGSGGWGAVGGFGGFAGSAGVGGRDWSRRHAPPTRNDRLENALAQLRLDRRAASNNRRSSYRSHSTDAAM